MSAFKPLMLQGTIRRFEGEQALAFQIVDPTFRIPMIWEVITAKFGEGHYQGIYRQYIVAQGKKVLTFFDRLEFCAGIERVWVTQTLIVVQGKREQFAEIAQMIKKVVDEVFGEFHHQSVGEDQIDIQIGLLMSRGGLITVS